MTLRETLAMIGVFFITAAIILAGMEMARLLLPDLIEAIRDTPPIVTVFIGCMSIGAFFVFVAIIMDDEWQ